MTLDFDHVHLSAPDQQQATAWYVRNLGAVPGATPERILVGERRWLIFYKADAARPSRDGVIDYIGFSVPDVTAALARLEADGARIASRVADTPPFHGSVPRAFVEDPYGTCIAIVQDPARHGFHHVHVRLPRPGLAFDWFAAMFGGTRQAIQGHAEALLYGDVWLLGDEGESAPSAGHAIDHIAWRAPSLDQTAAALKAKAVTFTMEPRQFNPTTRISFVEGPSGTRIEVLERRP